MGYTIIDKDEQYRNVMDMIVKENPIYISALTEIPDKNLRHQLWLCYMGLIETWNIKNYIDTM